MADLLQCQGVALDGCWAFPLMHPLLRVFTSDPIRPNPVAHTLLSSAALTTFTVQVVFPSLHEAERGGRRVHAQRLLDLCGLLYPLVIAPDLRAKWLEHHGLLWVDGSTPADLLEAIYTTLVHHSDPEST